MYCFSKPVSGKEVNTMKQYREEQLERLDEAIKSTRENLKLVEDPEQRAKEEGVLEKLREIRAHFADNCGSVRKAVKYD